MPSINDVIANWVYRLYIFRESVVCGVNYDMHFFLNQLNLELDIAADNTPFHCLVFATTSTLLNTRSMMMYHTHLLLFSISLNVFFVCPYYFFFFSSLSATGVGEYILVRSALNATGTIFHIILIEQSGLFLIFYPQKNTKSFTPLSVNCVLFERSVYQKR